jgi:hypothetical protein
MAEGVAEAGAEAKGEVAAAEVVAAGSGAAPAWSSGRGSS